jgi:hypothetical protein
LKFDNSCTVVNVEGLVPLANWPKLESLKLAAMAALGNKTLHGLAQQCPNLKHFSVGNIHVDPTSFTELIQARSLVSISLVRNRTRDPLDTINLNGIFANVMLLTTKLLHWRVLI